MPARSEAGLAGRRGGVKRFRMFSEIPTRSAFRYPFAPLLLLVAAAVLLVPGPAGTAAETKPNLVYIMADDLGYGDVQCLNPQRGKIPTPHLDRLAREGMTFTDAHSGSSVCTPTRYGLLTGRYAWRTRLQRGVIDGFKEPLIEAGRLTVPALLRRHGYHSAMIGKWHLGFGLEGIDEVKGKEPGDAVVPVGARTAEGPLTRGFDYFYGVQHARSMGTFFERDRAVEIVKPIDAVAWLTRRAVTYVEERAKAKEPFFLYYALTSPHTPIVPSKEWQGRSGLGAYADFVMETDWAVGEVLAALERAGVAERTLVIFTSDNGCSPQADTDRLETLGHFASAQFRGYKSDIWEGGHRVPFLVRWPGTVNPGRASDSLLCLTDLMATCAELLGEKLPADAGEDSVSFLPELLGTGRTERRSAVHHSIEGKFALRDGPWKLALCSGSGGWTKGETEGPVQLYHLGEDEAEQRNLAVTRPEVVARLAKELARIVSEGRSTPGPRQQNAVAVEWGAERVGL